MLRCCRSVNLADKVCLVGRRSNAGFVELSKALLRRQYRGEVERLILFRLQRGADEFVARLHSAERLRLRKALEIHDEAFWSKDDAVSDSLASPTARQLRSVAFHSAVPFIGFGLLDNAIMIIAGEYIDLTIGISLGISTMAAAALGNIVSDVSGIGLAHYVEAATNKLGFKGPNLSSRQTEMPKTRIVTNMGRAMGITVGCLLGMFPLFFYDSKDDYSRIEAKTKEN